MKVVLSDEHRRSAIQKAADVQKTSFDAQVSRSVSMVYKVDDEFYIWGPASVEVVDKENDKIRVEALEKALPQLLKRARLSYAHTDQIVGKILEGFETDEPVEVEIGGTTYERSSFPTDVLDLDKVENPALYVAGEVYDDTEQANDVREKIEAGEVNSYSISGEALVTRKKVEGDLVYDDILELDLSAVTLCEEGMNQGAKFARVTGDIENVTVPESAEKSFSVEDGRISSPDQVLAKSSDTMTEEEEETEEKSEVTKAFVKEQIDEAFDEQFEKRFNGLIGKTLPDGALVTKSYVDSKLEEKGDEDVEVNVEDDEDEDEEEEYEEEEEEEEMDEEEMDEEEMDEGKGFSEEELKDNLPDDVYEVVAEYLGTSKAEEVEETEETEKSVAEEQEDALSKHVEQVLSGDGPSTPTIGASEEERSPAGIEKDEEEDEVESEEVGTVKGSPALQNFDYDK